MRRVGRAAWTLLPPGNRDRLRAIRRTFPLPPSSVARSLALRRTTPFNRDWGFPRGTPVDRHYIERFLQTHGHREGYAVGEIHGTVCEVGDSMYARRFGDPLMERVDVLHVDRSNPEATVIGDLETGTGIPEGVYDCVICTQTLHLIYDTPAAVANLHKMLRPGGTLLVTVPGVAGRVRPDADLWGDYWRFTSSALDRIFGSVFQTRYSITSYGNVLACCAFLYGLAAEDLSVAELDLIDRDFNLIYGVRAVRED